MRGGAARDRNDDSELGTALLPGSDKWHTKLQILITQIVHNIVRGGAARDRNVDNSKLGTALLPDTPNYTF